MLSQLINSATGTIHLTSALVAMVLGAAVILMTKGTTIHKLIGYGYVAAMALVNVTAFMIYHLFGQFGPFHLAAIVSGMGVVGGMIPVIFRSRISGWLARHYYFMNWSVVGLYAAFWAETLTRLFPTKQFWPVVVLASGLTMLIGSYLINRNKTKFFGNTP